MTEIKDTYKVAYHTLGCKLNFAETSTIGKMLAERGFERAQSCEVPDIALSILAALRRWPTRKVVN